MSHSKSLSNCACVVLIQIDDLGLWLNGVKLRYVAEWGKGTITEVAISGGSPVGMEVGLQASAGSDFSLPSLYCVVLYCTVEMYDQGAKTCKA